MTRTPEPIWTGRYGEDRQHVIDNGQDFLVINYYRATDPLDQTEPGLYVYGPFDREQEDPTIAGVGENWSDRILMRAYNAEDAARNWWGAISQWYVWANLPEMDWETAPFTDEDGNFPETGGDHGGDGYDALPPDNTAKTGITRADLFSSETTTFIPEGVSLEPSGAAPAPHLG